MPRVPTPAPFVSYSQNGEDVVLWRALGGVAGGRYVDVGANHPVIESVTKVFHDAGWTGITVEPLPELAALHRTERPDAFVFEGVAADTSGGTVTLHSVPGTGLSSLLDTVADTHRPSYDVVDLTVASLRLDDMLEQQGWAGHDIHLVTVDTEGSEAQVLDGFDLRRWRPWVLVVEATAPNSTVQTHGQWEADVLAAGYRFCLFDGLSRYYVADERAEELAALLSYPACVLDDYVTFSRQREVEALALERESLVAQVVHWRTAALGTWADAVEATRKNVLRTQKRDQRNRAKVRELQDRITEMEESRSWRVTRPIRVAGGAVHRKPETR